MAAGLALAWAECRADCELPLARGRLRQQQVRDVHACDQQHKRNGAEQRVECRLQVSNTQIRHPRDRRRLAAVRLVLGCQSRTDRLHLGPRDLERHAPLQARRGAE